MENKTQYTRCPQCETAFKVTEKMLAMAKGKVRCGACLAVFQATDYLLKPMSQLSSTDAQINTEVAPTEEIASSDHPDTRVDNVSESTAIQQPDDLTKTAIEDVETIKGFGASQTEFSQAAMSEPEIVELTPQALLEESEFSELDFSEPQISEFDRQEPNSNQPIINEIDDNESDTEEAVIDSELVFESQNTLHAAPIDSDLLETDSLDADSLEVDSRIGGPALDNIEQANIASDFEPDLEPDLDAINLDDSVALEQTNFDPEEQTQGIESESQSDLIELDNNDIDSFELENMQSDDFVLDEPIVAESDLSATAINESNELDRVTAHSSLALESLESETTVNTTTGRAVYNIDESEPEEIVLTETEDKSAILEKIETQQNLNQSENTENQLDLGAEGATNQTQKSSLPSDDDFDENADFDLLADNLANQILDTDTSPDPLDEFEERVEDKKTGLRNGVIAAVVLIILLILSFKFWSNRQQLAWDDTWGSVTHSLCAVLPCDIKPRRDVAKIKLRQRIITPTENAENRLDIKILLTNNADFAQPYPGITIEFSNSQGEPVASKRFLVSDYFPEKSNQLMPADTEVHIHFETEQPHPDALGFKFIFD